MPPTPPAEDTTPDCRNEIVLVGLVRRGPLERQLPSGDTVVGFSLRIPRTPRRTAGPRGTGDSIDVGVWAPGLRRRALALEPGDLVEVEGSLHRQVRTAGGAPVSRHEVEALTLKRLSRAVGWRVGQALAL